MIDYTRVGERIKDIRNLAQVTQLELAAKLGVSVGYVCKLEKGLVKFGLDQAQKVSLVFRCNISWLLWGDDTQVWQA